MILTLALAITKKRFDLHRTLAEVFLGTGYVEGAIVNHKDGNKQNNALTNLEWVTYSGNLDHAYDTGLRTENTPVFLKNIDDAKVLRFRSIGEAARYLKVNPGTVFLKLKKQPKHHIHFGKYLLSEEEDNWPSISESKRDLVVNGEAKRLLGMKHGDKTVYVFESMGAAASKIGIPPKTFAAGFRRARLKGKDSYEIREWLFTVLNKNAEAPIDAILVKSEMRSNTFQLRKPPKVKVTDLRTGKASIYDSIDSLAATLGVTKASIQKYVWKYNGNWKDRLHVEYIGALKE